MGADYSKVTALIEKAKRQHEEAMAAVRTASKRYFSEASELLFAAEPNLKSFRWNQYTPYWNDGDTCEFGARRDIDDIVISLVNPLPPVDGDEGDSDDERDEDGGRESSWSGDCLEAEEIEYYDTYTYDEKVSGYPRRKIPVPGPLGELLPLFEGIATFMGGFEDDTLKDMFGDHVTVIVSRSEDGSIITETEEYEHE